MLLIMSGKQFTNRNINWLVKNNSAYGGYHYLHHIILAKFLDSRGNPTVETTVILNSGYRGTSAVPSGASVGKYEAVELRDRDEKRYSGKGVTKAVTKCTSIIALKTKGFGCLNQESIDKTMLKLDGTPTKSNLGANSLLSVSLHAAVAAANSSASAVIPISQCSGKSWKSYSDDKDSDSYV